MKQPKGWIKLHRQFLEWEWYDEPNCLRVFLHCLLRANHKDNKYRGDLIKRGTFVTSLDVLAFELKMGKQSLRTALGKLKKTGEINTQTNTRGTLVIICNYDTYQSDAEETNTPSNTQLTRDQHTTNTQLTTNKNDKNVKNANNDKNNIYTFDLFWDAYGKKVDRKKCESKWNNLPQKDKALILEFIPIYQAHQPDEQYRKNPYTFLNSEIWTEDWNNYQPKEQYNDSSNDFYQQLSELERINEVQRHNDSEGTSPVNIYQLRGR